MVSAGRRILYLVNALEDDAPTLLAVAMAREMSDRGWQTKLVAWSRGSSSKNWQEQNNMPAAVLGKGWFRNATTLARLIETYRPQIIHTALVRPTLGLLLARTLGIKADFCWFGWHHGVHEWREKGRLASIVLSKAMPVAYQLSDQVITVSENARHRLAERGVSSEKIIAISNGADARKFYPRPRAKREEIIRHLFPNDNPGAVFLVGSAGNLRYIKGFDFLLKAAAMVHKKQPGFRFVIWGDGPERAGLEDFRDKNNLANVIALPGHSSSLELLMPLLDCYVQPSRDESFGLAAVEAMMCGIPAVLAKSGGLVEVSGDGKAARLYPADNPQALATHLLDLAARPLTRERLGKAGRLFALDHFTQRRMADQMEQLYLGCVQNG